MCRCCILVAQAVHRSQSRIYAMQEDHKAHTLSWVLHLYSAAEIRQAGRKPCSDCTNSRSPDYPSAATATYCYRMLETPLSKRPQHALLSGATGYSKVRDAFLMVIYLNLHYSFDSAHSRWSCSCNNGYSVADTSLWSIGRRPNMGESLFFIFGTGAVIP
jgi:hypothetical protein